jgi:hypothetical protein
VLLGVDPGLSGALAWLHPGGALSALADMPVIDKSEIDPHGLFDLIAEHGKVDAAVIEWPHVLPINGAKTAYSMGLSLGIISTALALAEVPIHRITPSGWKRSAGIKGASRQERNAHARALATRQWPGWATEFRRVKDADRAEAALLAYWWSHKEGR